MELELDRDGVEHAGRRLTPVEMQALSLLSEIMFGRPGVRLTRTSKAWTMIHPGSSLLALARERLGPLARPVRMVLFDKTATRNWGLAWHQDRTIVVAEQITTPGFGPWSRKAGELHVEPPFEILAGMLTVRAHFDACDADNAPLLVAKGSHALGKVAADQASRVAADHEQAVCLAEPGDIWLYRTPILHASKAARRPNRRRVLQVDFAARSLPNGLSWAFA